MCAASTIGLPIGNQQYESTTSINQQYFDALERLKTFPFTWKSVTKKEILAINGFYYSGNGTDVICAFCSLKFRDCEKLAFTHSNSCTREGNIPLGDLTNHRFERHRLATFLCCENWVAPISPNDLAKSGFYWTGTSDVSRCAFCRLEVRAWEPGDVADEEHRKWNSDCAFMRGRNVGNVPIGFESGAVEGLDIAPRQSPHQEHNIRYYKNFQQENLPINYTSKSPNSCVEDLGVTRVTEPSHPMYRTLQSRIHSFENWPPALEQNPEDLAEAGFYYTGRGDRTICYQCGGGLKDWSQGDDPWEEHAKWFKTCPFVLMNKGIKFIEEVQQKKETSSGTNLIQKSSNSQTVSDSVKKSSFSGSDHEVVENDSRLCKVCQADELGVVILPCGHMATCLKCVVQLTTCPICRSTINAYVRAFLP